MATTMKNYLILVFVISVFLFWYSSHFNNKLALKEILEDLVAEATGIR